MRGNSPTVLRGPIPEFEAGIVPPQSVQDAIAARAEIVRMGKHQDSMNRGIKLAARVLELRGLGWSESQIINDMQGTDYRSRRTINRLLAIYGKQAAAMIQGTRRTESEIVERGPNGRARNTPGLRRAAKRRRSFNAKVSR